MTIVQNLYHEKGVGAVIFWVIALIAAAFGLSGIASAAMGIAKILFFILLVIFMGRRFINFIPRTETVVDLTKK